MKTDLPDIAFSIREMIISSLVPNESHHIGCSLSIVEILAHLYFREMKVNPKTPSDADRDIFILSKGHAALALYATLCKRGFFGRDLLSTYDTDGGQMPEHANTSVPGVELSTGSLGHGLSVGVGFSVSFTNDKRDNKVFVLMSDGEFNEGSNWEAIMFAGHHKLSNLIVIVDVNNFQGFGSTEEVIDLNPLDTKLKNFNWETHNIDGNNFSEIKSVFLKIKNSKNLMPKIIFAKTIKGKGISFFENKLESHYKSLSLEVKKELLENYEK